MKTTIHLTMLILTCSFAVVCASNERAARGAKSACPTYNANRCRKDDRCDFIQNACVVAAAEATDAPNTSGADCTPGKNKRNKCERITGPNGGAGACKFSAKSKLCTSNNNFVDKPEATEAPEEETEQEATADCSPGKNKKNKCERIKGPNGGAGACKYSVKSKLCKSNNNFVDDEPEATQAPEPDGVKADCSTGKNRGKCHAITGPNGGARACKFLNKAKECVNDDLFVDNQGDERGCSHANNRGRCKRIDGCMWQRPKRVGRYGKCKSDPNWVAPTTTTAAPTTDDGSGSGSGSQ